MWRLCGTQTLCAPMISIQLIIGLFTEQAAALCAPHMCCCGGTQASRTCHASVLSLLLSAGCANKVVEL
jgi:hypothetical protein